MKTVLKLVSKHSTLPWTICEVRVTRISAIKSIDKRAPAPGRQSKYPEHNLQCCEVEKPAAKLIVWSSTVGGSELCWFCADHGGFWRWKVNVKMMAWEKSEKVFECESFSFFPYTSRIGLRLGEKANGDFSPTQLDTFPPTRCVITRRFFSYFFLLLHPHSLGPLPPYYYASENFIFSPTREFVLGFQLLLVFFSPSSEFYVPKSLSHNSESDENVSYKRDMRSLCENENVARSSSGFIQNTVRNFPSEKIWSHRNTKKCWSLFCWANTRARTYEYMTTSKKVAHSAHIKVYIMWRENIFCYIREIVNIIFLARAANWTTTKKSCSELVILITSCRSTQKEKNMFIVSRSSHIFRMENSPRTWSYGNFLAHHKKHSKSVLSCNYLTELDSWSHKFSIVLLQQQQIRRYQSIIIAYSMHTSRSFKVEVALIIIDTWRKLGELIDWFFTKPTASRANSKSKMCSSPPLLYICAMSLNRSRT